MYAYNYEPDKEKGEHQCISTYDSSTLIFSTPIMKNIQSYYIYINNFKFNQ